MLGFWMSVAMAGSFVQGSVVAVREAPAGEAVAQLRIGTEVDVVDARGGWSRVSLPGRPAAHPVEGWVRSDLLGPLAPTLRDAVVAGRSATALEDATRWAERAMALDPWHAEARAVRREAAVDDGDAGLLARLDAPSEAPVWLAWCEEGERAVLLGRLDADGALVDEGRDLSTLREVAAWAWYRAGRVGPLSGSPFPAPFLTVRDNEEGGSAYVGGTSVVSGGPPDKGILGPCRGEGLLATSPLHAVREGPAPDVAAALDVVAATDVPLDGLQLRRPVDVLPYDELVLDVWLPPRSCGGGDLAPEPMQVVTVLDGDGQPLDPRDDTVWRLPRGGQGRWVRMGDRHLGVYLDEGATGTILSLWVMGRGAPARSWVGLSYYGC